MACLSEDDVLNFSDGRLASEQLAEFEAHLRACSLCEQLVVAALAARTPAPLGAPAGSEDTAADALGRGTLVGRYTVLASLGGGGMGEVYAAYDPQLDRRIALKLLRSGGDGAGSRAEARLMREARAIAQLSHRNVIAVHDVGTFGARVFVAMEYVAGQTLSAWLGVQTRTHAEILKVFLEAANGLAAAHAAGLVHRDFKPQNVMVAGDGTVRVMDFGLVRRIEDVLDRGDEDRVGLRIATNDELSLTATGELLGTPLYMSPEQFKRMPTDARTDQFSFCVALYEALYGEHPYAGRGGINQLKKEIVAGRVRPAPERNKVPPRLRRVLLRGLAVIPDARWPSMADLATAIARVVNTSRRRAVGVAALAVALVAAAGVAGRVSRPRPQALCGDASSKLAGVWLPPASGSEGAHARRATVQRAFSATGVPEAAEIWARTEPLLDRYAADWLAMHQDACEATHVRGEQSEEVLDLRMQCLDQRQRSLKALVDLLATADRQTVGSAVDAVTRLPDLSLCANVTLLHSAATPRSPVVQARVDGLRRRAEDAKALYDVGRHAPAIEQLRAAVTEARKLGDQELLAELLTLLGTFFIGGEYDREVTGTLDEAAWTAVRARRDDLAAESAALLTGLVGCYQYRPIEGRQWAKFAEAELDRMGGGGERIRAWVLQGLADITEEDDIDQALRLTKEALALKQRVLPPEHPDIALSLLTEAEQLYRKGDAAEAVSIAETSERILVASYGPSSPHVAWQQSNRGEYLLALGRSDEALRLFRNALVVWEAARGPSFQNLAYPLTVMGRALLALGRPFEARAPLERALHLRQAREHRPIELGETYFALAQSLWATGDRSQALDLAGRAENEYTSAGSAKERLQGVRSWLAKHEAAAQRRPIPAKRLALKPAKDPR